MNDQNKNQPQAAKVLTSDSSKPKILDAITLYVTEDMQCDALPEINIGGQVFKNSEMRPESLAIFKDFLERIMHQSATYDVVMTALKQHFKDSDNN